MTSQNNTIDKLDFAALNRIKEQSNNHIANIIASIPVSYTNIPVEWNLTLVQQNIPQQEMFLKQELIHSTHGIRHILRVMIFSSILSAFLKVNPYPAIIAALFHDLRRENDFSDKEHGNRGEKFFLQYTQKNNLELSQENILLISEAIKHHDEKEYKNDKNIYVNILKCADALDRYRLKNEPGWPKKERVPIPTALSFCFLFRKFTLETELSFLKGNNSISAITNNLFILGRKHEFK